MEKILGEHQDKDFLKNQKIIDVDFLDHVTVFYLENGYDVYFWKDGKQQLVKIG